MVIKSIPIDDMNTVVFAIRGSQTFMDWAVNLRSAPALPEGFLVRKSSYFSCPAWKMRLISYRTTQEICVMLASYPWLGR